MGLLQQVDKAIDKVERSPNGLVWKTLEFMCHILNCYDVSVRFYITNSTIKRTTTKIKEDVERPRSNNLKDPKLRSNKEGVTRLDAAAATRNS